MLCSGWRTVFCKIVIFGKGYKTNSSDSPECHVLMLLITELTTLRGCSLEWSIFACELGVMTGLDEKDIRKPGGLYTAGYNGPSTVRWMRRETWLAQGGIQSSYQRFILSSFFPHFPHFHFPHSAFSTLLIFHTPHFILSIPSRQSRRQIPQNIMSHIRNPFFLLMTLIIVATCIRFTEWQPGFTLFSLHNCTLTPKNTSLFH